MIIIHTYSKLSYPLKRFIVFCVGGSKDTITTILCQVGSWGEPEQAPHWW